MGWLSRLFARAPATCQSCGVPVARSAPDLSAVARCVSCGRRLCGRCVNSSHNGGAVTHRCPMCGGASRTDTPAVPPARK
jgi:predicted RNA-binding Zn-ribbon protein involved in translation (DUF1610 family)